MTATHPKRHPDCAFRAIAEEGGLVVLAGRAEVKVLNPAGIRIFGLLDGRRSLEQIAEVVAEEFDVTPAEALADTREFVAELTRNGMLLDEASREVGA